MSRREKGLYPPGEIEPAPPSPTPAAIRRAVFIAALAIGAAIAAFVFSFARD